MNLLNFETRANLMNTESKNYVAKDVRPRGSTCDGSSNDTVRDAMPPSSARQVKQLETSEDIERALHIASSRSDGTLRSAVVVLVALVVVCLVMAAIVWWRLLT